MTTHDDWYFTRDPGEFLARAGDFLRSRPARHTVHLTVAETLRTRGARVYGASDPEFGVLAGADGHGVRAAFLRTPPHPLVPTALTGRQADALAARLAGREHDGSGGLTGVNADDATAAAFAAAWRRHTGARTAVRRRLRLYRLGELTAPRPAPPGRARTAGAADRELLARWYVEFSAAVGEAAVRDPADWAADRAERGDVLFWEAPDGTPVAMAGSAPPVAGQIRVNAVYTPAHLRGRGYAGAVTAEVSRAAARTDGVREVLLFADLANPTSNGLYQRIGYRPVSDFAVHTFTG
ncbi:GNAT family N-acetyltransferase [Streptomyces sp. PsTaAH-124]|uniref:GNAT family N-acetyltransferase n=1 Tax=Streptomyces sp. PsTaAH-124 TaxID=1157638 RepID=UPI00035DC051|nr:GNAT family N-acetyltransferase [Streptomyces sp. PsTaAH-124]